jgi:CBS domain-containing protein
MKVLELMQKDVKTCSPDDSLESIALMMWNHDCGSIPVVDPAGKPIGIITDRDIAMSCALNHKSLWDLRARDVTNNRPLFTCYEDDDMSVALATMQTHRIRRLPAVDDDGQLQGLISIDDVVARSEEKLRGMSYKDAMHTLKAVCVHH